MPKQSSRKPGKSSDPNYERAALYLPKSLCKQLKLLTIEGDKDMSTIVEEALSAWLTNLAENVAPVAKLRKKAGLSQKELAEIVGVPPATIADLEEGRSDLIVTVSKICDALDCSFDDLRSPL